MRILEVALLVLVAGSAVAQEPTVRIEVSEQPALRSGPFLIVGGVVVDCPGVADRVTVVVVSTPVWMHDVRAVVNATPGPCQGTTARFDLSLSGMVRDAPAYAPAVIMLNATVEPGGSLRTVEEEIVVVAAYEGSVSATPLGTWAGTPPSISVRIVSLANARSSIVFEPEDARLRTPPSVAVGASFESDDETTVLFAWTGGCPAEAQNVLVRPMSMAERTPGVGTPVQVPSPCGANDAPGPGALVAVLGVLALTARMRSRRA